MASAFIRAAGLSVTTTSALLKWSPRNEVCSCTRTCVGQENAHKPSSSWESTAALLQRCLKNAAMNISTATRGHDRLSRNYLSLNTEEEVTFCESRRCQRWKRYDRRRACMVARVFILFLDMILGASTWDLVETQIVIAWSPPPCHTWPRTLRARVPEVVQNQNESLWMIFQVSRDPVSHTDRSIALGDACCVGEALWDLVCICLEAEEGGLARGGGGWREGTRIRSLKFLLSMNAHMLPLCPSIQSMCVRGVTQLYCTISVIHLFICHRCYHGYYRLTAVFSLRRTQVSCGWGE